MLWLGPTLSILALTTTSPPRVLCIGETLFDGLASGIYLGGAPLNVACHLSQLGVSASYVSAVGADRLGIEARRRLNDRGVDTSLIGTVEGAETGFVTATLDAAGDASYEFVTPAAWDFMEATPSVTTAAAAAGAVVLGTLGSRAAPSRTAIRAAAAAARMVVCDVNLRPPIVENQVVAEAVFGVDLLKLNDEEMLPVADALRVRTESDAVLRGGGEGRAQGLTGQMVPSQRPISCRVDKQALAIQESQRTRGPLRHASNDAA